MPSRHPVRVVRFVCIGAPLIAAMAAGCAAIPNEPEDSGTGGRVHLGTPDGGTPRDGGATGDARTGGDGGTTLLSRRLAEICGNGLDDDNNGTVDDGCACVPREVQQCYPGNPAQAGVGMCTWGTQPCVGEEIGNWGDCTGYGGPALEVCDGLDNNCDGMIDEGCSCVVGTTRSCYDGPPGTEGVGTCHAGTQTCQMVGTDAGWGACVGSVHPTPEVCDHGDHNCDGHVDDGCYCPDGATPTFHRPATGGGSGILPSGSHLLTMTCDQGRCPPGEAAVANDPSQPNVTVCVAEPPPCPAGQQVDFVNGMLACVTCDVIVQYGGLYGNQRVCAPRPTVVCGGGEVPTFVYETRTWECRPTCDNGQYDQATVGGMLVCIPC